MRFVLWGTYCENALVRAPAARASGWAAAPQRRRHFGDLGPTEGSTHVFAYEAESREQVKASSGDVYWRNGIWTDVEVYP